MVGPMSFLGVPQSWARGYPRMGVLGYPNGQVRVGGGTPGSERVEGVPWGIPCGQVRMGVPPGIGQQSEHLLCDRRYASCVHAGGLSCFTEIIPVH